jgi:hypothetical protein
MLRPLPQISPPRLVAALLALAAAAVLALPAAAPAMPRQSVAFEAPRELLSWADRERTLDEIQSFGITRVRQLVYWNDFAPSPNAKRKPAFDAADPSAYPAGTWDRLDALVRDAGARGITLQLTLTGPVPKWATSTKKDHVTKPSPKEFRAWATAVGARYGAAIDTWSIWNEPNQPQFLAPQYVKGVPYSPHLYRRLYQVGVQGLKRTAANADDTFLIGETSPRGNSKVVFPLDFFRRMLCLTKDYKKGKSKCGMLAADGYAHHAYTTAKGPRFVPPDRDDVTIGVLSRLERALDLAAKAKRLPARLPVYLTEFGIQSRPDRIQGVSFQKQAAYMAVAEHMAYVNPRVASFSQYLMSDDPPRASKLNKYAGFESGLRSNKGKKKPAYRAFRLPLAVEKYGDQDVLWGLVRQNRAATRVTIEVDPPGDKRPRKLRTVKTTATGVFGLREDHVKGRDYRVVWTSPNGQRYTGAWIRAY